MNLKNDNNADERRNSDHPSGSNPEPSKGRGKAKQTPEVGNALRAIYQNTIDEHIPAEMLDLLGKLG